MVLDRIPPNPYTRCLLHNSSYSPLSASLALRTHRSSSPPPPRQTLGSKKLVTWVTEDEVLTRVITDDEMTLDVRERAGFKWISGWQIIDEMEVNEDYEASDDLIAHAYAEYGWEGKALVDAVVEHFFPPEDTTMKEGNQKVTPTSEKGDDDLHARPPPGLLNFTPTRSTKGKKRPAEGEPERAKPKTSKTEGAFGPIRFRHYETPEAPLEEPGKLGTPLPPGKVVEETTQQKAEREAKEAERKPRRRKLLDSRRRP